MPRASDVTLYITAIILGVPSIREYSHLSRRFKLGWAIQCSNCDIARANQNDQDLPDT